MIKDAVGRRLFIGTSQTNENKQIYFATRPHLFQCTTQKMKFSIKDCFSKCDQIRSFLRIWSHLLKKSLMESFIFCAVVLSSTQQQLLQNTRKHGNKKGELGLTGSISQQTKIFSKQQQIQYKRCSIIIERHHHKCFPETFKYSILNQLILFAILQDTGCKWNVHATFKRWLGRLLNNFIR